MLSSVYLLGEVCEEITFRFTNAYVNTTRNFLIRPEPLLVIWLNIMNEVGRLEKLNGKMYSSVTLCETKNYLPNI